MNIFNIVLCIALGFGASGATAQSADPVRQLNTGDYDALEARFTSLQSRFERHQATEFDMLDAFKPFYMREDALSQDFARWIAARPTSWVPRLARGVYFRKLGELNRGEASIAETPPERIAYMTQMFEVAKQDINAALVTNPRLYIAEVHLLNIAQFEGDDGAANHLIELANRVLPDNLLARARFLIHLEPRWGGSEKQMNAFIQKSRSDGLSVDKLRILSAIEADDLGDEAERGHASGDAMSYFVSALKLTQDAPPRIRRDYLVHTAIFCPNGRIVSSQRCE